MVAREQRRSLIDIQHGCDRLRAISKPDAHPASGVCLHILEPLCLSPKSRRDHDLARVDPAKDFERHEASLAGGSTQMLKQQYAAGEEETKAASEECNRRANQPPRLQYPRTDFARHGKSL